jgi:gamma-glutamyltranspeptidase/glutathione hydrolase
VPGVIAGWESLWAQGARLPWRDAFSRAMHQAADGVPVARSVADALALERNDLVADAGMRALFFPDGEPLAYGARLVQPRLAESLEQIAAGGANAFYRGDVGDRFRATLERLGSALSADDFAAYEPELTQPLRAEHGTAEVLTAPPNSQGAMLLMILAAAPDADGLTRQAPALAAAFSASIDARSRRLADPRFDDGGADPPRVVEQRADRGDTVAIVSADADGRAVSLIQSVFHSFGAGILDPSTGIVAHNRGSFFSLDPASPNVLAGGKRPAHTLTPVLVCEGGELSVVLGTRGGRAQPQILAQILQRLWLGSDAAAALAAPRWIVGDGERELLVEGRVPAEAADALTAAGWSTTPLADFDMTAGQSQLIVRAADGAYSAATDPRCEGLARTG